MELLRLLVFIVDVTVQMCFSTEPLSAVRMGTFMRPLVVSFVVTRSVSNMCEAISTHLDLLQLVDLVEKSATFVTNECSRRRLHSWVRRRAIANIRAAV